jgi:hypothetical protein
MAHRRFHDRKGQEWEVRTPSKDMWEFGLVDDSLGRSRTVPAPGYERDPYELSVEELQRLLDGSIATPGRARKSPFKD